MPTNPPANPLPGAVYVDQSTNLAWVWTGTYWLQATGGSQNYNSQTTQTTSIIPGYYAEPSPDSWIPFVGPNAPANPACGQIWIDNSVIPNYAQVWDCNTGAFIQLGGVPGGDTNSIVSTVAPTIRPSGDPLQSGDFWINPINNGISYWNGTAWDQISTPDTHTVYSLVQPSTRLNGDPLIPGDLWTDAANGNLMYWTGVQWNPIVAVDLDHQLATSPPVVRPDGTGLQMADLYTNTTSGTLFYFDGASWNRYNDTHSFQSTAQPTTRPDGSTLEGGDQWFNPTTDNMYVWDSITATWVLVTTNDTHSWWSAVAPATRPDGTALQDGDMWANSVMNIYGCHTLKVWHTNTWHCVGEKDTHSFLDTGAPTLAVRPDGTALLDGDLYIDISTSHAYYYRTATSSWTTFGTDTHAWIGAGDPIVANPFTVRPNGSMLIDGDIYVDTTTNQGYYYNTATSTWKLFASDTHSSIGAGDPIVANPITLRPDGTALQDGDQYIDTVTQEGYYYDTSLPGWKPFGADSHSFTGFGTPYIATPSVGTQTQTTRPNGTPLADGDQYMDIITKVLYTYILASGEWVETSLDTHSFTGNGEPVTANPILTRFNGSALVKGDMYIDEATEYLYYFTGLTWERITSAETHSFTGNGLPNAVIGVVNRPDGDPLVDGDQYFNTATNLLYTHIAGVWILTSKDTHSFTGNGLPGVIIGTVSRPDGVALAEGDQYLDTSTNYLYTFTAGAWVLTAKDTHSFTGNGLPNAVIGAVNRPDGSLLVDGDQYLDTSTNYLYTFTAGAWVLTSKNTHSFTGNGLPNAIIGVVNRPDGSPLVDGDQYFNTATSLLYTYVAGAWVLTAKDTHSFTGNGLPNVIIGIVNRPDGSPLVDGDQYLNTATSLLYTYVAGAWVLTAKDTHSFSGAVPPTNVASGVSAGLRPDGTALVDGDQYIDTATQLLYSWYGTQWNVISSDTHSFVGNVDPASVGSGVNAGNRPDGTPLKAGDMYVNTVTDEIWYYDTGLASWVNTTITDTHSFTGTGTPYIATPSVGTNTQTTRPDGTTLLDGDLYWDKATNILYAYNGTEWILVSEDTDTHSFTGTGTPYIATPSVGTNPQTTRPDGSALLDGDLYWDKGSDILYGYNGTEWVPVSEDTHSFTGLVDPTAVGSLVDTGTRPDGVTTLVSGDQYINSSTNSLYYWNGASWGPLGGGGSASYTTVETGAVAATSIDLTSLPAGIEEVHVQLRRASMSTTAIPIMRLSSGGVFVTSGYQLGTNRAGQVSGVINGTFSSNTTSFVLYGWRHENSPNVVNIRLYKDSGNQWMLHGETRPVQLLGSSSGTGGVVGGWQTGLLNLPGALDGLRFTTGDGSSTINADNVIVRYR